MAGAWRQSSVEGAAPSSSFDSNCVYAIRSLGQSSRSRNYGERARSRFLQTPPRPCSLTGRSGSRRLPLRAQGYYPLRSTSWPTPARQGDARQSVEKRRMGPLPDRIGASPRGRLGGAMPGLLRQSHLHAPPIRRGWPFCPGWGVARTLESKSSTKNFHPTSCWRKHLRQFRKISRDVL